MTLDADIDELRCLIENHHRYTASTVAANLLDNWNESLQQFVKVFPADYKRVLEQMTTSSYELLASSS